MSEYDEAVSYDDDRDAQPTSRCEHGLTRDVCGVCQQKNMNIEPPVHHKSGFVSSPFPKRSS
jgi:hypothetical protein